MKVVVVTGHQGAVGASIASRLAAEGYDVIGIDRRVSGSEGDIALDLATLGNPAVRQRLLKALQARLQEGQCVALINNAAVQHLGSLEDLSLEEFMESQTVNVFAPLLLSKYLLPYLARGGGQIINIGSIHAQQTKPGFVSYATSKGALATLSRALAVDIGERVRVNTISPAAIDTNLLRAGFQRSPELLETLERYHPTRSIGSPAQVAGLVAGLLQGDLPFLNGADIELTGGIGARLHDPA